MKVDESFLEYVFHHLYFYRKRILSFIAAQIFLAFIIYSYLDEAPFSFALIVSFPILFHLGFIAFGIKECILEHYKDWLIKRWREGE